jgi:hypothetical protein
MGQESWNTQAQGTPAPNDVAPPPPGAPAQPESSLTNVLLGIQKIAADAQVEGPEAALAKSPLAGVNLTDIGSTLTGLGTAIRNLALGGLFVIIGLVIITIQAQHGAVLWFIWIFPAAGLVSIIAGLRTLITFARR